MEKRRIMMGLAIFIAIILTASFSAAQCPCNSTVKLSVGDGVRVADKELEVPIVVDKVPYDATNNPVGIAGAAFTLVYDSKLNVTVSSKFFDTFEAQFTTVKPTYTGDTSVTVGSETYDQPLLTNAVPNTATGFTYLKIAAARCIETALDPNDPSNRTLFVLNITTDTPDTYDIGIEPTVLNNEAAGYDAAGEAINLLVGAAPATVSPTECSAFPLLLCADNYQSFVEDGKISFTGTVDSDGDGLKDSEETALGTDPNKWDTDGDGYSDGEEANLVALGLGTAATDPKNINSAPTYIIRSDFNRDGKVDYKDLNAFILKWGKADTSSGWDSLYNLKAAATGSQKIDYQDLNVFILDWGKTWTVQ